MRRYDRSDLHYQKRAEQRPLLIHTWPRLARTRGHLVMMRPRVGSRRGFAHFMAQKLPAYTFDSTHDRWQADLDPDVYRATVTALTFAADNLSRRAQGLPPLANPRREIHISPGVTAWAGEETD